MRFTLKDTDTGEKIDFDARGQEDVIDQLYADVLIEECPEFDLFEGHDAHRVIHYTVMGEDGKVVNVHIK
jgi:hypothetical protein